MSRHVVSRDAEHDIEDIYVYIGIDSRDAAVRFLARCEETIAWLAESPRVGRPWPARDPRNRDVRVWSVAGFRNHLIFYRPIENGVFILHVTHAARDLDRVLGL